jgi:hypothetical protein
VSHLISQETRFAVWAAPCMARISPVQEFESWFREPCFPFRHLVLI